LKTFNVVKRPHPSSSSLETRVC